MGFFKLGSMTLSSVFKKPETLKYPYKKKKPYTMQKGTIVNDKINDCTLCSICQKRCPTSAIMVDRENRTWSIDHFKCIQCGYCQSSCPKKCITMKTDIPKISIDKKLNTIKIPEQSNKSQKTTKHE